MTTALRSFSNMNNPRPKAKQTVSLSISHSLLLALPLFFLSAGAVAASDARKSVVRVPSYFAGGKIVSLRASPFTAMRYINAPHVDQCIITVKMIHPALPGGKRHRLIAGELKLIDGRGRNIELFTDNASIGYGATKHINTSTLTESRFVLDIARTYATHNPLTLRGRIKVDNKWKVPFSLRLPPR